MNRKQFMRKTLAGLGGLWVWQSGQSKPAVENEIFSPEEIRELVFAAHRDFDKTKRIVEAKPLLLNCTNQGKRGDFETALGGASHMGLLDIVEMLIAKGARMDIFTHAVLGHTEIIQQLVTSYPVLLKAPGPHGFTLLHHAKVGKQTKLAEWIEEQGLTETHFKGVF